MSPRIFFKACSADAKENKQRSEMEERKSTKNCNENYFHLVIQLSNIEKDEKCYSCLASFTYSTEREKKPFIHKLATLTTTYL